MSQYVSRRDLLRRPRRTTGATAALSLLAVLGATVALRAEYAGNPAAYSARSRGHDALWLGHAWVDGRRTPADLERLRARVEGTGIHDLYVHTGPLGDDGALSPSLYPAAAGFLAGVRRVLPGVRVQARLGDTVAHDGAAGLRPDDPAVRARIHASARQVLDAGFQGVKVAGRCDRIAVMAYDTAMPAESLYGGYVAQQTALALEVTPATTDLLIGLPAFHTGNMGHHAYAETVGAAVRGARVSLARHARDRRMFGLALYADFDATAGAWQAYRTGWGHTVIAVRTRRHPGDHPDNGTAARDAIRRRLVPHAEEQQPGRGRHRPLRPEGGAG